MSLIEAKTSVASMLMSGAMAAAGFAAPWPEVVAGYFFAVAGGFAGMVTSPPTERVGITITIVLALVIGTFAGLAHPYFGNGPNLISWVAVLPIQLVMGVSGLASRQIARRWAAGDFSIPWHKKGTSE